MIVIPAIDIKGGQCVRLRQGKMEDETVYSDDPLKTAKKWAEAGAEIIHVVDLDAAIEGWPVNIGVIQEIAMGAGVPIQIGGGIRDKETAQKYLTMAGVKRVILGTAAFKDRAFLKEIAEAYPGKVAVGIDAKDGLVAIKGWVEVTDKDAVELAREIEELPLSCIIYTDIARDGMLGGPNLEATERLIKSIKLPVIASGGVSGIKDIEALKAIGAYASIVGKAIYTGDLDARAAIELGARKD